MAGIGNDRRRYRDCLARHSVTQKPKLKANDPVAIDDNLGTATNALYEIEPVELAADRLCGTVLDRSL